MLSQPLLVGWIPTPSQTLGASSSGKVAELQNKLLQTQP
jgi:hypothetical protein